MMRRKQAALFLAVSLFLVISFFAMAGMAANAEGILPDQIVGNAQQMYQKYPFTHYMLDYQETDKFSLNIFESVKAGVLDAGQFMVTNGIWLVSMLITQLGMFLVGYAYDFDFAERVIAVVETCMQRLLGVTENGFSGSGFFGRLLVLTLIGLGAYLAVTGILRRQFSRAYTALVNYFVVFVFAVIFTLGAGTYVRAINDLSNSVSVEILNIGNDMVRLAMDGQESSFVDTGDVTDSVKELLFEVQIRNPWIILEFGDSNVEESRIKAIESLEPADEERQAAVEAEIEEQGNEWMTNSVNTMTRLVYALLLLVVNVVITMFVLFLSLLMVASKIMFLLFMFLMPVFFIAGLIPGNHKIAYNGMVKAFNCLLTNLVINLILTISFVLSAICYFITSDMPYLVTLLLQGTCFYAVYRSLGKINDLIGFGNLKESAQQVHSVKERARDAAGLVAARGARVAMAAATAGASEQAGADGAAGGREKAEGHVKQTENNWNGKTAQKAGGRPDNYTDMPSYRKREKEEGQHGMEGGQQEKDSSLALHSWEHKKPAQEADAAGSHKGDYQEKPTASMEGKRGQAETGYSLYEEKKRSQRRARDDSRPEPAAMIEEYKKKARQEKVQYKAEGGMPEPSRGADKKPQKYPLPSVQSEMPKRDGRPDLSKREGTGLGATAGEQKSRLTQAGGARADRNMRISGNADNPQRQGQGAFSEKGRAEPAASIQEYRERASMAENRPGGKKNNPGLLDPPQAPQQYRQWHMPGSMDKTEPGTLIEEYKQKKGQLISEMKGREEPTRETGTGHYGSASETVNEYASMTENKPEAGKA